MIPVSRERHGLTLLELIVGLVVVALMVTAGYATFGAVIDRRAQIQETLDPVARAATLRHTLAAWLRVGQLQVAIGAVPQDGLHLGMGGWDNQLRFVTTAPTPMRTTPVTVFLYVNTTNPRLPRGLVALLTPQVGADSMHVQLNPVITGMRVELLPDTSNGLSWMSLQDFTRDSASVNGKPARPPIAVRLTLLAATPDALPPLLRLPIVVPVRRAL